MDIFSKLFTPGWGHGHGPTDQFLHAYSSHPQYFLSQPFLWKVQFDDTRDLVSSINTTISKNPDEAWRANTNPDNYIDSTGNILVARSVTVPNENTQFDPVGTMNLGGFLPGYAVNKRVDFLSKNLVINFFETEEDIEHLFFRPWMVALGIDGLMMRDLLCPIVTLLQYNNRGQIRKGYQFLDVFPTNVEGYTVTQNDTEFLEKSVTFAFKNYRPWGQRAIPVDPTSSGGGGGGGGGGGW